MKRGLFDMRPPRHLKERRYRRANLQGPFTVLLPSHCNINHRDELVPPRTVHVRGFAQPDLHQPRGTPERLRRQRVPTVQMTWSERFNAQRWLVGWP